MARTATKAAVETHVLEHLIPGPEFFQDEDGNATYLSRTLDDGVSDIAMLRYARLSRQNVLLYGPTGPGKTSLVLAYAAKERRPLVTVQCNGGIDPASFWGGNELDETTGLYRWVWSDVALVIMHGGIVYLDEVNFLPPRTSSAFHPLLDKRRQVTVLEHGNVLIHAHPETQVVAAYNPDYEGTKPLNAAFKNRWPIKVEMDYDAKIEAELLAMPVLQEFATKLRLTHKNGDLETPVSTNMLIEFEVLAIDVGYNFALTNFLNAFAPEERSAVKEAFDLFSERVANELREAKALGED